MTALAFKDGVFCCDSQVTSGNLVLSREMKFQIIDGDVVTGAGSVEEIRSFMNWAIGGYRKDEAVKLSEDTRCYQISGLQARHFAENNMLGAVFDEVFMSDGCYSFLSGAMASGASSIEAVVCACIFEISCSFPIYTASYRDGDWNIEKITERAARDLFPNLMWEHAGG